MNVSLDSLKRERFNFITRTDGLHLVLNGIKRAKEGEIEPVKINTVIIRDFNDDEVYDFVNFAREWEVEYNS